MNRALIAIGSNLGDREYWVNQALHLMNMRCGRLSAMSKLHQTKPIGAADQMFLNGACILETPFEPQDLLQALLRIEMLLGRERNIHWGNRTIDLDIILWQNHKGESQSFHSETLTIPHPEATERDFVMKPAMEIAGDWVFPNLSLTVEEIASHKVWHSDRGASKVAHESLAL